MKYFTPKNYVVEAIQLSANNLEDAFQLAVKAASIGPDAEVKLQRLNSDKQSIIESLHHHVGSWLIRHGSQVEIISQALLDSRYEETIIYDAEDYEELSALADTSA